MHVSRGLRQIAWLYFNACVPQMGHQLGCIEYLQSAVLFIKTISVLRVPRPQRLLL